MSCMIKYNKALGCLNAGFSVSKNLFQCISIMEVSNNNNIYSKYSFNIFQGNFSLTATVSVLCLCLYTVILSYALADSLDRSRCCANFKGPLERKSNEARFKSAKVKEMKDGR